MAYRSIQKMTCGMARYYHPDFQKKKKKDEGDEECT